MLRVPNEVKHFAWQACSNALPAMVNLLCCQVVHAVWSCKEAESVWSNLSWANLSDSIHLGDFTNLISSFLQVSEAYKAEIFILTAWLLWNQRNVVHLSRPTHPLGHILSVAGDMLQDFLNPQVALPVVDQIPISHQCCPPDHPQFKANFNGGVFNSINAVGIGVVVRDVRGDVVGALSMRIPLPQTVAEVEVLECRRAVQFVCEIGIHEVTFEGDSVLVIQALKSGKADRFVYGHIIDDVL